MKGIGESMKGIAALAAGGGLSLGVKHALGDGAELAHEIQALKNAGRTAKEVAEGIAEANRTIGKLPTTTISGNIKLLNETTGAFGDYRHALENLQFNARLGSILQNTVGDKAGDPGEMFNSLVRAFEIRGTAADHHTYQREVGELFRSMVFSRGNVNPQEFLNFAQQANPAIKDYSERFLTKIAPSLIQEFGGERAGTRAGAWYNAIMGKTRDKRMADAWTKLGLLNDKDVLKNKKNGEIIGWNPGAIKGTDEAMADPLAWTEKYLVPALEKAGIDVNNQMSVTKELGKLFRNSEANRFANAITQVRDRKRLRKDEGLISQVPDAEKMYDDTLLNDPKFAKLAAKAALKNIGESLTVVLMPAIARSLTAIARGLNSIAQVFTANPNLAKGVGGVATALAAMAAVRIASFVLGVTGLGRALLFLAMATPLGLAGRLLAISRGFIALSAAVALGAASRIRTLITAIALLGTAGGARIVLASLATGILALGRAILLLPVTLLRGAFVGLAAVFTPIGAAVIAVTAALTALGIWTYNNLSGIGAFFTSFGTSFMKALGPEAASNVSTVVGWVKQAWEWVNKLLGPIDESGAKWGGWGEAAGTAAASVVTALSALPGKISALTKEAYNAFVNFNWNEAGVAIINGIVAGITGAASKLADAAKSAASSAVEAVKNAVGLGGGASSAAPASGGTKLPGRYKGGPVTAGSPYIVGERGPEIFVPNGSGRIETNGVLNSLSKAGGRATDAGGLKVGVDATAVEEAGKTAQRAGEQLHASLDATRKPIVDTASIDEAIVKAERLKAILSGGAGSINVSAAGGGSGSGSGAGAAAVRRAGEGGGAKISGPIADAPTEGVRAEVRNYLRTASAARGIDPNVAERVMRQESGFNPNARNKNAKEASFGVFQLNTKGGLGNVAERQGINPRDPSQWRRHIDFGLDVVKRDGWRQWYGARDVGIGRWQGIGGKGAPAAEKTAAPLAGARATGGPVGRGLSYLVGERGPEIFTPGATGQISTNGTLNRLAELGSRTVSAEDGGTSQSPAPAAGLVAKLRPQGGNVNTRGDTHYSPSFAIHGANDPQHVQRQVETHFFDLVSRHENDQRGLLSD